MESSWSEKSSSLSKAWGTFRTISAQSTRRRTRSLWVYACLAIGLLIIWKQQCLLATFGNDIVTHPIRRLVSKSQLSWKRYDRNRYTSFRQIVDLYRKKHQRHPPPGFDRWYQFAREKGVYLIDDFDQIHGDIRPFWGVSPETLRSQIEQLGADATTENGLAILTVRNGSVPANDYPGVNVRLRGLTAMVSNFAEYLPDMDIILNTHDQPRIVTPWDDIQSTLATEAASRGLRPRPTDAWPRILETDRKSIPTNTTQQIHWNEDRALQKFAIQACAPDTPARQGAVTVSSEAVYKDPLGGFITNFTLSTDLCTVGPKLWHKHGILYDALTLSTSQTLLPVFSESKTGVHNDILFPGLVFYDPPKHFAYDAEFDYSWPDKTNALLWRGTNSGGQYINPEGSMNMHRSRLVLATMGSQLTDLQEVVVETQPPKRFAGASVTRERFAPADFASAHTDTAFNSFDNCNGNCQNLRDHLTIKENMDFKKQFAYKYLIDIDGHSFSGRWRAFLQSRSLAIKSTIFRDWHDSRLFAWAHFVPLDNRYDELWNILTYFIGYGEKPGGPTIQQHDAQAEKIARQGREWAAKVLRKEDMEVYTFRLLLEYARVIREDRDTLGYGGNGREFEGYEARHPFA